MKSQFLNNKYTSASLSAVLGFCLWSADSTGATWGSIRANNHEGNAQPAQRSVIARGQPGSFTARGEQRAFPPATGRAEENRGGYARQPEPRHEEREAPPPGAISRNRGFEGERERGEFRRFEPSPRPEFRHEGREHWHEDFDRDRLHSYFWFNYSPGMIINTLPPDYSQVYVSGVPYYYDQGVYYQPGPSGYVVVPPPVGAIVAALPPGAETIPYGATYYYYAGGAFYVQTAQGFLVVAPPVGITVPYLPPGAQAVTMNGMLYYRADGAYFMPVMEDGVTVYTTAQP